MSNKSRQPKVQKAIPGTQRYADASTNSVVGRNARVETIDIPEKQELVDTITTETDFGTLD